MTKLPSSIPTRTPPIVFSNGISDSASAADAPVMARTSASFSVSADTENDADVLAITGASAALALSEIPFEKTIGGVRVGIVNGNVVINPTYAERKESTLDLIVAGSKDGILMVEAGAKEVTEAQAVGGLEA